MSIHCEAVDRELLDVLLQLMQVEELKNFRLVGGTGLALQFGHRKSIDIDLFAGGGINTSNLTSILSQRFGDEFALINRMENGISGLIRNVKIDLFDWKVAFAEEPLVAEGIRMASPHYILAYKCESIMDRKAEKDFCDMAMLMEYFDLDSLLKTVRKRYPYISSGALLPFLLKPEGIVRDQSINFLYGNTFDKYVEVVRQKLRDYEQQIRHRKELDQADRMKNIQDLIAKKKSKDNTQ